MNLTETKGYRVISEWLAAGGLAPFPFQRETWQQIHDGRSGLVNAPTGCGKTFSVFLGALIHFINNNPDTYQSKQNNGLQLLWVSPLRALAKDIGRAMEEVITALAMPWRVGIRNGDTGVKERERQKKQMPEILIITPESLHLLLAQKNYPGHFKHLHLVAVDEWHELIGSKRGVQVELALSRLAALSREPQAASSNQAAFSDEGSGEVQIRQPSTINHQLLIWGLSATIGNLDEAMEVLLAPLQRYGTTENVIVRAAMQKKIYIESIIPGEIEKYPWAGHLGIKLAHRLIPIIHE
jgi:ATP-dependent helicase Lhr and Lhr-like helicase